MLLSTGFLDRDLTAVFGTRSFDVGSESTCFTFLLNGHTRTGSELRASLRTLQGHAHGARTTALATAVPGPVALTAAPVAVQAGACGVPELGEVTVLSHVQRDISHQLSELAALLDARPGTDPARASFLVADCLSTQALSSH